MREYSFDLNPDGNGNESFDRVNAIKAKNAYENGELVVACPVNMRPGEPWHPELYLKKDKEHPESFENVVNAVMYYNCNNETGKYLAFYLSRERETERGKKQPPKVVADLTPDGAAGKGNEKGNTGRS